MCDSGGPVTMSPVDRVPWLLGQGDVPLAKWLAHMTLIREEWVQSPPGSFFTLPHSGVVGRIHVALVVGPWIPNVWQPARKHKDVLVKRGGEI